MNIKIFENDDHLVIDISKAGLKKELSENTILAAILSSIANPYNVKEIPGLETVVAETEPELPKEEMFTYNGCLLKAIEETDRYNAMLSLWKWKKTHELKVSEIDALKEFVREELCFIDENTEDIAVLKNILVLTGTECNDDEADIRTTSRAVIDDMLMFAIKS